jgi:hypothetical protein
MRCQVCSRGSITRARFEAYHDQAVSLFRECILVNGPSEDAIVACECHFSDWDMKHPDLLDFVAIGVEGILRTRDTVASR